MKSCSQNYVTAAVFAALTIIGCSISSMRVCHKQRTHRQRLQEEAVQTWEAEGGAVAAKDDEEEIAART
ncbi:MAG TPA: hypothetical protein VK846_01455 [Candidatus Limnocylindria bacterium]|nr:hypothetical protein [Candidatus Limnocylindria bacterium]